MTKEEYVDAAIINNESLNIEYMKYDGTISQRTISDIHYSTEYGDGTSHIDAFCHKRNERRTFKIDRIRKIEGWTPIQTRKVEKRIYQPSSSNYSERIVPSHTPESTRTTSAYNSESSYQKNSTPTRTNSNSSEGCYIATMVYGDYNHPQVRVLREFRDQTLAKTIFGRLFIKFYYFTSPKLVAILKDNLFINKQIKKLLDKFIDYLTSKK